MPAREFPVFLVAGSNTAYLGPTLAPEITPGPPIKPQMRLVTMVLYKLVRNHNIKLPGITDQLHATVVNDRYHAPAQDNPVDTRLTCINMPSVIFIILLCVPE